MCICFFCYLFIYLLTFSYVSLMFFSWYCTFFPFCMCSKWKWYFFSNVCLLNCFLNKMSTMKMKKKLWSLNNSERKTLPWFCHFFKSVFYNFTFELICSWKEKCIQNPLMHQLHDDPAGGATTQEKDYLRPLTDVPVMTLTHPLWGLSDIPQTPNYSIVNVPGEV